MIRQANQSGFGIARCLSFLDAPGSDLFETYLDSADLRWANLEGSNLSGSHLCDALVVGANLREVEFQRAHLDSVDFSCADIDGAKMPDARLRNTRFSTAQLQSTQFTFSSFVGEGLMFDVEKVEIQRLQDIPLIQKKALYRLLGMDIKSQSAVTSITPDDSLVEMEPDRIDIRSPKKVEDPQPT
jgi:uncharacterized protein YjbI with pentapeptide repeats